MICKKAESCGRVINAPAFIPVVPGSNLSKFRYVYV
jgi:hypothetical protein